jgi:hypothetical protein
MAGVEDLGDRQVDHGVTEELEALVVAARALAMFVQPAGMDERLFEEGEVADREPEALREGGRPAHRGLRSNGQEECSSM